MRTWSESEDKMENSCVLQVLWNRYQAMEPAGGAQGQEGAPLP